MTTHRVLSREVDKTDLVYTGLTGNLDGLGFAAYRNQLGGNRSRRMKNAEFNNSLDKIEPHQAILHRKLYCARMRSGASKILMGYGSRD